jgi:hypothetical protein
MPSKINTNNGTGLDIEGDGVVSIKSPTTLGDTAAKLVSFYGATRIAQPSSTGENTGFTAVGGTTVQHQSTFTGNSGSKAYTINDIVKHLKALGLLAAS